MLGREAFRPGVVADRAARAGRFAERGGDRGEEGVGVRTLVARAAIPRHDVRGALGERLDRVLAALFVTLAAGVACVRALEREHGDVLVRREVVELAVLGVAFLAPAPHAAVVWVLVALGATLRESEEALRARCEQHIEGVLVTAFASKSLVPTDEPEFDAVVEVSLDPLEPRLAEHALVDKRHRIAVVLDMAHGAVGTVFQNAMQTRSLFELRLDLDVTLAAGAGHALGPTPVAALASLGPAQLTLALVHRGQGAR